MNILPYIELGAQLVSALASLFKSMDNSSNLTVQEVEAECQKIRNLITNLSKTEATELNEAVKPKP